MRLYDDTLHAGGGNACACAAVKVIEDAKALEHAGCFAVVVEAVPSPVTRLVVDRMRIPTIGIGAGAATAGQVLVQADLVGTYHHFVPRCAWGRISFRTRGSHGQTSVCARRTHVFAREWRAYTRLTILPHIYAFAPPPTHTPQILQAVCQSG